jgi:DNA polymerase-3 subunit gamma/tau
MSYLVLARKWRPQTFEQVVGQRIITKTLKNAIEQNRVAHAMLFCGPRGVGKTSVARILAKAMNCEKGPTPDPCGECPACREISQGTSLDVHEIDGASNRGIEEIRKLKETVMYLPASLTTKIIIIDEVHMLTKEAFNALLKTLEEPPEHVIFILATTEPHKIPPTILSRCQRYDFRRVPFHQMVEHLKRIVAEEGFEADEKALMLVAREATGSLRDAEVVLDQLMLISENGKITIEDARSTLSVVDTAIMMQVMRDIIQKNPEELLRLIHELVDTGMDLAFFYRSFLLFLHDLLLLKAAGDREVSMERGGEEIKQMREVIRPVSLEQIEQWIQIVHDKERFVLQSEYSRIGLESALLQMVHLSQAVSINALIRQLEARIGQGDAGSEAIPHEAELRQESFREKLSDPAAGSGSESPVSVSGSDNIESPEVDASADPGETDSWEKFLAFVKQKAMPLSVQLSEAFGYRWQKKSVEILFPQRSFSLHLLQSPEKEKQLKSLFEAFSNRKISRIIFKEVTGKTRTGKKIVPETLSPKKGLAHTPAVRDALGILGGKLVEIKPLRKQEKEEQ